MNTKLSELLERYKAEGLLTELQGPDNTVTHIAGVSQASKSDLVFVESKPFVSVALKQKPGAVVTTKEFAEEISVEKDIGILVAPNVRLAHAVIKLDYQDRNFHDEQWERVHPTAVIHPSVEISNDTVIGPHVVIQQGAKIGKSCRIMAGVVIENNAIIGDETTIHPNGVIGFECQVGKRCLIGPGTIVGSEGYGFAQDEKGRSYRIPHQGKVILQDDVRLGANNCLDRGTYTDTVIGRGTKTDNLCHFGHNVIVGEDCLLTAHLTVGGSSKIGNRVMSSGQTGIINHMEVCDDAIFVHRAGVTQPVTQPGMYAGLPLQPIGEYRRNSVILCRLSELSKKVNRLEKAVKE